MDQIKAIVSDMDGVLWRGKVPLPGLGALFDLMQQRDMPFILATNNSSKTRQDYVQKLAQMGVSGVGEAHIITSATATGVYLQKHYTPGTAIHVFGSHGLREAVELAGFHLSNDGDVRAVVAGLYWEMDYDSLRQAAMLIRAGADFIGTNPDLTYPVPEGEAPGAGSLLAALEAASGIPPVVVGKPNSPMFEAALDLLGTAPEETLMIGDRLNTDIAGAVRLGMRTALVLTGVSTSEELAQSDLQPDEVYEDLPALVQALSAF